MIVTESHDWYLGEESTHEVKAGDRVRLINKGGYNNYQGTVTKIQMHGKSGPWADIKWDMPHHPCTTPMETKHLEVVVTEGQHPLPQDTHATDLNELTENNLQEKKTTMKKSELTQEGFIQDKLNNLFKINFRKLIKLLEKSGFSKDEYESGYLGLTYTKALDLTADDDGEGHVSVRFSSRVYDDITIEIYEEGFDEDIYYTVKGLSKKSDAELSDIVKKINSHVYRTDRPSPNSSAYKAYQQKRNDRRSLEENKHSNTMKKSELKSLLKVIIQEVVAAKQKRIDETKGLSGFKKSKDSTDHTENVADSKDLTGKGPTEKTEPTKLKYKKPATPKVGIKEEIMAMIRESIEEMARVAGAVGSKFKVKDASSPTGWSVKGHKSIPDGTPTDAPKGPYVPKGIAGMGRPKKSAAVSADGEQTAGATLNVTFDGDALQFDFLNSTWPQAKKFIEAQVMSQLGDAALDPNVKVGQSVYDKIEAAKELDIDGKLNASNNNIDLTFDAASKQLVAK